MMKKNRESFVFVVVVLAVMAAAPRLAFALELGLTPSHVFGIWLNINTVVLEIEMSSDPTSQVFDKAMALKPRSFSGKKPADVFIHAKQLQSNLSVIFDIEDPPQSPQWILDYQVLEGSESDQEITPSQVFVLSSNILHALVTKYSEINNHTKPVSPFYKDHKVLGKNPSDVFGLVDLAGRRLAVLKASSTGGD